MATHQVSIILVQGGPVWFPTWVGVGGSATTSGNAYELAAGDVVNFKVLTNNATTTMSGFNSNFWTNTSNLTLTTSNQSKTVKSNITLGTVDNITVTSTGGSLTRYFTVPISYEEPDNTIDLTGSDHTIEILPTDTSHTITIINSGSSTNASITQYKVTAGGTDYTRTGHGALTVSDVPSDIGIPETYSIQSLVTTANGGENIWVPTGLTYSVTKTIAATTNNPTIDAYGLAIYDDSGTAVTSFTAGHTVLRKIYESSVTTSTSSHVDLNTSLTGLTNSNCVINIKDSTTGVDISKNVAMTIVSGTTVRVARTSSAFTGKVTVLQHTGSTIGGTQPSYGLEILNGDSGLVIDSLSEVYGVREIINLDTSQSNVTDEGNPSEGGRYITVELTSGRYPASGSVPIAAIKCDNQALLLPPRVHSTHSDGSYRYVQCLLPAGGDISDYTIAMLVSSSNATPASYGGSSSLYGLEVRDSSNNLKWSSDWRQAVINNVVPANQFTTGTNQNGNYDVTTGYDGVTAPVAGTTNPTNPPIGRMISTGQIKGITGLHEMDPANTYLLGNCLSGWVKYRSNDMLLEGENASYGINDFGGGVHIPGCTITSSSSISITMHMIAFAGPYGTNPGSREATSHHPDGHFVFARIT